LAEHHFLYKLTSANTDQFSNFLTARIGRNLWQYYH